MSVQNQKKLINRWIVSEISIIKNQILKTVNNFGVTQGNEKEHERHAKWLRELRAEKHNIKQSDINITRMIIKQIKRIPNWKSSGPDGVQSLWLKKLTA